MMDSAGLNCQEFLRFSLSFKQAYLFQTHPSNKGKTFKEHQDVDEKR